MSGVSKKFGGQERADAARKELAEIFADPKHPLYLEKDISLALKYGVSRLTIYGIRNELGVSSRSSRILTMIKKLKSDKYTIQELADLLNVKYQNIYKIVCQHNVKVKPDVRPIDVMIEYKKAQKEKRLSKENKELKRKKILES